MHWGTFYNNLKTLIKNTLVYCEIYYEYSEIHHKSTSST
jgi:hypothetical protein